ncbi:small integral membrane protein 29 [Girardinichthys multiradiatus]|uniref:small integral membrane protein 29 n=1 Tax=Girardinichthys multiradiatus TaxID=208333 RepID=UPI001FAC113B|nr:small integral membrane protein 29 [Girardinichthys multiradiatus]
MNSTTTQPPAHKDGGVPVSYVLVPLLLITIAGIATALIVYLRRKRRVDRLRHQLLPVYTYDPAEELHEAEQELLWREEDTRILQGWARSYQQHQPLLTKDVTA